MRAAALLVATVLLAGVGTATAAKSVNSKVKITAIEAGFAKGKVKAKTRKCRAKRKVVLYSINSDPVYGEFGAKTRLGSDRTNRKGGWRIDASLASGDYEVTAKRKRAGGKRCKPARKAATL